MPGILITIRQILRITLSSTNFGWLVAVYMVMIFCGQCDVVSKLDDDDIESTVKDDVWYFDHCVAPTQLGRIFYENNRC
jgi:hypothetical protein